MNKRSTLPLDCQLQETISHGNSSFPLQYYVDNLSQMEQRTVPLHWHTEPEFFSVISGCVDVQISSGHITLSGGETILINGQILHGYSQITEESECICPNLVFASDFIAPVNSDIYIKYLQPFLSRSSLPYILFSSEIEWQKQLLTRLFHTYALLSKYGPEGCYVKYSDDFLPKVAITSDCFELEVLQDLCQIFQLLYRNRTQIVHTDLPKTDFIAQIRLQKMTEYIQKHYSEKITINDIAASAVISRSEAGRCFQKYYHCSPVEYVIQYRLNHARLLLLNSSLSIKEIGYRCGFQDPSYFVKTFRRHLGLTPNEFRYRESDKR